MIKIIENFEYEYNKYMIQYSEKDGLFHIFKNNNEIGNGFVSDVEANEFIDNISDDQLSIIQNNEENDLPIKTSTTLKVLKTKYDYCTGIAYILSSEYKNKYATKNGIGFINDPDLSIFKSAEAARDRRRFAKSNFGITEIRLDNGNIKIIK